MLLPCLSMFYITNSQTVFGLFLSRHTIPDVVLRSGLRNCAGQSATENGRNIHQCNWSPSLVPCATFSSQQIHLDLFHISFCLTTVFFVYQGMDHLYKLRFFAKTIIPIEELFTLWYNADYRVLI
jgi:hypothetical protein